MGRKARKLMRNRSVLCNPVFVALLFLVLGAASYRADGNTRITLCNVIENAQRHDGTIIQFLARFQSGFEESFVVDDSCPKAKVWLDFPSGRDTASVTLRRGGARFAEEHEWSEYAVVESPEKRNEYLNGQELDLTWKRWPDRTPVVLVQDDNYEQLMKLLSKERKTSRGELCISCPVYSVTATITGRFEFLPGPVVLRDPQGNRGVLEGYGHLSLSSRRVVLQSVSDIVATKIEYGNSRN